MKKMSSTYANNAQGAKIMPKRPKNVQRAKVKLYRASSHSPLEIEDSAKEAFRRLKRETAASVYSFIRIECSPETGFSEDLELGVYFDDKLERGDVVYLNNKILFILDKDTTKVVAGRQLCFDKEFYLASAYGLPVYRRLSEVPEA